MQALLNALSHRYQRQATQAETIGAPDHARDHTVEQNLTNSIASVDNQSTLIEFINALESLPTNTTLQAILADSQQQWALTDQQHGILSSIDDCSKLIFRLAAIEPHVESQLRRLMPQLAAMIIENPATPLKSDNNLLTILDTLNEGLVGWVPHLGAGGDKLQNKLHEVVELLKSTKTAEATNLKVIQADLTQYMLKESNRIEKLEKRMVASETGIVRSTQARILSANMINKAMSGKQLTLSCIDFLQGPWYESIQLLLNEKGLDSAQWQRASTLTETLVSIYQPLSPDPDDNKAEQAQQAQQRLFRIVEHLPNEVRQLLVAIEHDTLLTESALDLIEADQVNIVSGMELNYVGFEPLVSAASDANAASISSMLLRKVNRLEPGQWFLYESEEQSARIKLVLKLDDVRQLIFTNRNGMKVLQTSYDNFAYDLSSRKARLLNEKAVFTSTFRTYYQGLIEEYEKHQRLLAERKASVERLDEDRKKARVKALKEAERLTAAHAKARVERISADRLARLADGKSEAEKTENAVRVIELTAVVHNLATGAYVMMPGVDGSAEECKLAVRIASPDKMIFVNHSGNKVAEYNTEQLVALLVSDQAKVSDAGVKYEDTLAKVVSKLRQDRNKSYDDLTGE
jgi:hypothetical protein